MQIDGTSQFTDELNAEKLDWEPNDKRFQEYEESMTSYGGQLMGKDDNDNTLIACTVIVYPWCNIMAPSVQTIFRRL